jgi:hypothetical protein
MRLNEPADCVSDLELDEWASGELDPMARDRTAQHVMGCSHCRARHQEFERERAEFYAAAPTFDSHARRFVPQRVSARRRHAPLLAVTGIVAIAAAVAIAMLPSLRETRLKGGPSLGYFVKRAGHVWAGDSSTVLMPGDLLRFTYTTERDSYLAVLDQDARSTQVYFPNGARAAFVPRGVAVALDFSVQLDSTPGEERVYALFCETSVEIAPVRASLVDSGRFEPPDGCKLDTLTLRKAGAR